MSLDIEAKEEAGPPARAVYSPHPHFSIHIYMVELNAVISFLMSQKAVWQPSQWRLLGAGPQLD